MNLPSQWIKVDFGICLSNESSHVGKVQKKDYLEAGQYPVIDQGQTFISGYTNEHDLVYQGELPVILFGDHTLTLKYIDFPFVCGADGIKVLIPNKSIVDSEYFYYFLKSLDIQSRGYSRHYKQLRKTKVIVPPLPEQQRIAEILHQTDSLRRWRWEVIEKSKKLLSSLFIEMFGRPSEWQTSITLGKVVDFIGGGTPSRQVKQFFTGDIPWATSKDIKSRYLKDAQEHITEDAIQNSATNLTPINTILIVVKSKILMHSLPIGITTRPFCFGQDIKGLICKPGFIPQFILAAMLAQTENILKQARGVNTEGLTLDILRLIPIPDIDTEKQQEFLNRIFICDNLEIDITNSLEKLENLFSSIICRTFTGEITSSWRENHNDELQQAVIERDKALGLKTEKSSIKGFREGKVTQEEAEKYRNMIAELSTAASQSIASMLSGLDLSVSSIAKQITLDSSLLRLADLIKMGLPNYTNLINQGLADAVQRMTEPLRQSIADLYMPLAQSFTLSLAEALRQSTDLYIKVLMRDMAGIAASFENRIENLPLPQPKRAIHENLDPLTLSVLKLAVASSAYFIPDDVAFGDITPAQASSNLQVLEALGFVRLVRIDDVLRYHLIDEDTDLASKPSGLHI